jgi:excisionase family DNA binding protein
MEEAQPEFLTVRELAALLRIKERKVYDLAASGEVPCSKVTGKLLFPEHEVRSWIAGGHRAPSSAPRPALAMGSHDPLLEWALRQSGSGLATYFDSSLDGVRRFVGRDGILTGLHLQEPDGWNIQTVTREAASGVLIAWATRVRGLVTRPDAGIETMADLAGRRVATRQAGSGTQAQFLAQLAKAGLAPDDLGEPLPCPSETDAVLAVTQGQAEAAFGLEAVARPFGLTFTPLTHEVFDLLADRKAMFDAPLQKLWAFTRTPEFRTHAETLSGYDISALGNVRWNG